MQGQEWEELYLPVRLYATKRVAQREIKCY